METTIACWGYIRMMENQVETPLISLLAGCCLEGQGGLVEHSYNPCRLHNYPSHVFHSSNH